MAISDRIAVMGSGEIAQLGDAEELYRRPVSEFVARFIGRTNVIEATVRSVSDTQIDLDIAGKRRGVAGDGSKLRVGTVVKLVMRPEAIKIGQPSASDAIAGVVVSCTYLGDKCEYVVDACGLLLEITKANPQPPDRLSPGAPVGVLLPTGGLHLLREENR
jgi:ABC-type Fe3+/spermidine/putrescine transport system ATPase subunit